LADDIEEETYYPNPASMYKDGVMS